MPGNDVDALLSANPFLRSLVKDIREQKAAGMRPVPSASLISMGASLPREKQTALLDRVAALVDENYVGRHEMCQQFGVLLARALNNLRIPATPRIGEVTYQAAEGPVTLTHVWVETPDGLVIDGNCDSLVENPILPHRITPAPYWGPRSSLPPDRRLPVGRPFLPSAADDEDLNEWWPELKAFLATL